LDLVVPCVTRIRTTTAESEMAREILYANGALYTVEPEEIADIKVLKTIVGGKPVWEEPAA